MNHGQADAGSFQAGVYFTTNGDIATAKPYHLYCDVTNLVAGDTFPCSGTVTFGASITPGVYYMLGVADANNSVPETDRSGGTALASTGPLTVTF